MRRWFDLLRANMGDALSSDETTPAANVAEDMAAARLLAWADRFTDLRVNQWYPRKVSVMLERWEAILGVIPTQTDTEYDRRQRIASRLLGTFEATQEAIQRICDDAFYPWTVTLRVVDYADAESHYPGYSYVAATPWYSTILRITVEYERPLTASDEETNKRIEVCTASLDEHLPAYTTFNFSETFTGYTYGFTVGVSSIGSAAIGA